MRVVMVIGKFHPFIGGAERQCLRLSVALVGRGHDVRVLTVRPSREYASAESIHGVAVARVGFPVVAWRGWRVSLGALAPVPFGWRLWRSTCDADIIHAHCALWPAFVATVIAVLRRKPVVVKLGNSGERFDFTVLAQSHWYGRFAVRFLCAYVTYFVATSRAIADDLRAAGVPDTRIALIPNGVACADVPVRVGSSDRFVRCVFVGTLTPKKNVALLIDSVAAMSPAERAQIRVTVCGDGPLRAALASHARACGVDGCVVFRGMVYDVSAALAASDVFVLPSTTEGLSNAALEAMAAGLPVVLRAVGGNTDLVTDAVAHAGGFRLGAQGILVDGDDPARLAAALAFMVQYPDVRTRCGVHARATVAARYTLDAVADAYVTLYRRLSPHVPR